MVKKILTILCVIALMFSIETKAEAIQTKPICNSEEVVTQITKLEDVDKKWWSLPYNLTKYNSSYYATIYTIEEIVGAKPYWREGRNLDYYAIYKTDTTHYLFMTFSEIYFIDGWYVSKIPSKELFQKYVVKGTPLKVIKLIDPGTSNAVEGTSYMRSYHRFNDGTMAVVDYNKNANGEWIVDELRYEPDDADVINNLLDIDYQLIKNDNPNEEAEFLEKLKKLNEEPQDNPVVTPVKKKPAKVKIKSAKRIKKKSIRIKFQKVKNAKKYQIQYASNRKFKKAKIRTTKKTNCIIKTATTKTYYIRVRGVNGTKKGAWSKVKKVKSISK